MPTTYERRASAATFAAPMAAQSAGNIAVTSAAGAFEIVALNAASARASWSRGSRIASIPASILAGSGVLRSGAVVGSSSRISAHGTSSTSAVSLVLPSFRCRDSKRTGSSTSTGQRKSQRTRRNGVAAFPLATTCCKAVSRTSIPCATRAPAKER